MQRLFLEKVKDQKTLRTTNVSTFHQSDQNHRNCEPLSSSLRDTLLCISHKEMLDSEWVTRPELPSHEPKYTHPKTCMRLSWSYQEMSGRFFAIKTLSIITIQKKKKKRLHFLYAIKVWGEKWLGHFFLRLTPSALFIPCHSSMSVGEKSNYECEEHLRSIFNIINRQ